MVAIMATTWVFRCDVTHSYVTWLIDLSFQMICLGQCDGCNHGYNMSFQIVCPVWLTVFAECILRREWVKTHHLKTYIVVAKYNLCIRRMDFVYSQNAFCEDSESGHIIWKLTLQSSLQRLFKIFDCCRRIRSVYLQNAFCVFAECSVSGHILRIQCASVVTAMCCNVMHAQNWYSQNAFCGYSVPVWLLQRDATSCYGVTLVSRIDRIIGLFRKRALQKRRYSWKETYDLIDPTDRSHPICDAYIECAHFIW